MVGLSFAGALLAAGVIAVASSMSTQARLMARFQQKLIAEQYASELLEYYLTFSTDEFITYHKKNPITLATSLGALYVVGPAINILNRTGGAGAVPMWNPDPRVSLPSSGTVGGLPKEDATALGAKANRWYRVQVYNLRTEQMNAAKLNTAIGNIVLGPDETFRVTVGVEWLNPKGKEEIVVLSSVLPIPL